MWYSISEYNNYGINEGWDPQGRGVHVCIESYHNNPIWHNIATHYTTLQKWAKLYRTEPCWPCCINHAGLVWSSSLQLSFMTFYTVKQTGLTRGGPQKCASVNLV